MDADRRCGKQSPFKGITGYHGEVTPEIDAAMRRSDWHDNIAIRHTEETVSIDLDEGDGKHGATTFAALSAMLGDLPPTYTSTARGQDDPCRQHFYRKSADSLLITTLTTGLVITDVTMETGDIELPSSSLPPSDWPGALARPIRTPASARPV